MDGPIEPSADFADQFQEGLPVAIVKKEGIPAVASGRHMIEGASEFESEAAGHEWVNDVKKQESRSG